MGSKYIIKNIWVVTILVLISSLLPISALGKEKKERRPRKALVFDWEEKVSASVFTRGNILWTIFDQPRTFDPKSFDKASDGLVMGVEAIPNRYYTIMRFELDRPRKAYVQKFGLQWIVHLSENAKYELKPLHIETINKPPAIPHVFVGVNQKDVKPVRITDPLIGDELMIIPLSRQNAGVAKTQRYVDFSIIESAQGLAIQLLTDELKLYPVQSALNIVSPSMQLASVMPRGLREVTTDQEEEQYIAPDTLMPFDEWQRGGDEDFKENLSRLEKAVLNASPGERVKAQLVLAQFLLSHQFDTEAWGLANVIQAGDEAFGQDVDVMMLKGVAAFEMRKYLEAQKIFASITPPIQENAQKEIGFWNLAVKAKINEKTKIAPFYLENKDSFVARYPLWLRQNLALTAAEQHILSENTSVAKKTLDALDEINEDNAITNDITYLKGLFAAHHNQSEKAESLWEGLTQDVLDRYNRTRAQMSLVELLLSEGKIDVAEAIKRLNTIRLSWRGDELERNILKILGQFYISDGDFLEGLRVWREIVTNFPNTPDALYIATKMTQTFIYLFNQGGADDMSPLEALALYYEFQELTPIGEQRDMMVQRVADRLFAVDLLDQAAILLTHQVRYRLQGEEKVKLGTKLAMLHLWNKRPELALEVLDLIEEEEISRGIGLKRYYLRAQALLDTDQFAKALDVLDGDSSKEASALRADIYWKMKRWDRVAVVLMPKLRRLSYRDRELTSEETYALLRLATVYALQEKKHALYQLYRDFNGRIPQKEASLKQTFQFLAGDLDSVDYRDVVDSFNLTSYNNFLDKYLNYAKENGLSQVDTMPETVAP